MSADTLLIEIGCEEIPARMIPGASGELEGRLVRILDQAGIAHGVVRTWGGPRRLAVRVEGCEPRQTDRDERVLGPPAAAAFDGEGKPRPAAEGFARKHGLAAADLSTIETDKGLRVGFTRSVAGKTVGELLAAELPGAIESMPFPKTMRWGAGRSRWVRPVHWVLALHGKSVLCIEVFGVTSGDVSWGHRFLAQGPVRVAGPDDYARSLEQARVIVDPAQRRERIDEALRAAAEEMQGRVVDDPALMDEVTGLVEWPLVVHGRVNPDYLELPRELLITTLRHHQKCFCVQDESGALLPGFLAVANLDVDREGHIQRGNEWVVGGRLEDARFFWREDRKSHLADRAKALDGMVFHTAIGTYADTARRLRDLAGKIAGQLSFPDDDVAHCAAAAELAKNDLVTATVGEFPELQGQVGGLMLEKEGAAPEIARAVYEHYRPVGPDDAIPETPCGRVVAVADKLDIVTQLIGAGERPTGSRDPYGLRRAANGIFRILLESGWDMSFADLFDLAGQSQDALGFLQQRFAEFGRERGYTTKEIQAVLTPEVSESGALAWPLHDIVARLDAIQTVRGRSDFERLVELTKRVDNILVKNRDLRETLVDHAETPYDESQDAARSLDQMIEVQADALRVKAAQREYRALVDILSGFIDPVDRFFADVLVIDKDCPEATWKRLELLVRLKTLLTGYFDIRELAGQAERRP